MSVPYIASSGDEPKSAGDEWVTVLDVEGTRLINWISLINEGDSPGFWRLVDVAGAATAECRLPVGGGDVGSRRMAMNITCPGFSGQLQIRSGVLGGRVEGIYAFGSK